MIAAAAAALVLAGCSSDNSNPADGKYIGDLQARGVSTSQTDGAPPGLGHAICDDLGKGSTAPAKLMQVANLQLNHKDQFTMPQAEIVVYWAVTELCPKYAGQLQDPWKDGG